MLARINFIILFSCLLSIQLFASVQLVLNDSSSSYTDFHLEYLKEKNKHPLSIAEVSTLDFDGITANKFTLGYTDKPVWFRLNIHNSTSEKKEVILEISEMFHKTVDLYTLSKPIKHERNGLKVPVSDRDIQEVNPSFTLSLEAQETKQFYIKLESAYSIYGAIQIKSHAQYYKEIHVKNYILMFYIGAIVIIILYNLFIHFYLREKIYLYYVGSIFTFVLWVALYKSFLLKFIDMKMYDLLQISLPTSFIMLTLFLQSILETKKYVPLIHKILNSFILIFLLSIVWIFISFSDALYFMHLSVIPLLSLLLLASLVVAIKGHKIALIYFIVLLMHFTGISMVTLLSLELVPYTPLLSYAPVMVSFFTIILFALLLAYRINRIRRKSLDIENKLLIQQRTENTRLFHAVAEKTAALNKANKLLAQELKEKEESEKNLTYHASTDSLTGLMNRRSYFDICKKVTKRAISHNEIFSFLTIDIDKFKAINDTHGHPFGDEVIRYLGKVLIENSRSMDSIGRIGGEEFAILMPKTDIDEAFHLADRLREKVAKYYINHNGISIRITVSIGISYLIETDKDLRTIIERSDRALYEAKDTGRNKVCIVNT